MRSQVMQRRTALVPRCVPDCMCHVCIVVGEILVQCQYHAQAAPSTDSSSVGTAEREPTVSEGLETNPLYQVRPHRACTCAGRHLSNTSRLPWPFYATPDPVFSDSISDIQALL